MVEFSENDEFDDIFHFSGTQGSLRDTHSDLVGHLKINFGIMHMFPW
jgi:hypothetical protein